MGVIVERRTSVKLYRKTSILFLLVYACILSLSFNTLFFGLASAEITKLSPEIRNKLQPLSRFHQINHVADLPVSLVKLFANNKGGLADPGKRWQVTDVVLFRHLPFRRLIWAIACGTFYVIHYESGGRAHGYHIILGTVNEKGEAKILWHGVCGKPFKNFEAFRDAVKDTKSDLLDDRLDYYK